MKKIIFGFLIVFAQLAYSQITKNFGDFSSVKAYDRINVTLIKSSENKVEIKGDDSDVEIVNKNGELKIRMIPTKIMQGDKVYVTVYYEKLNVDATLVRVKTNSGGMIDVSGNTETQEVLVNSGASFNGRDLKSEITSVTANAGGNAEVYASKTINATTRAGGNIEVYGSPKDRNTKNVIGGKIKFR